MQTFTEADAKLGTKEIKKLENNTHLVRLDADRIGVRLHQTYVVVYHRSGKVAVDSGTWRTVTTKDRINKYTPCRVSQVKFEWFVGGKPFVDDMTVA